MIADIRKAAQKAIFQIQPFGTPEGIYTEVKEGLSESFASFTDCLMQVVDRQVSDEAVKPHLLRRLAFANASAECKPVISAMPCHD